MKIPKELIERMAADQARARKNNVHNPLFDNFRQEALFTRLDEIATAYKNGQKKRAQYSFPEELAALKQREGSEFKPTGLRGHVDLKKRRAALEELSANISGGEKNLSKDHEQLVQYYVAQLEDVARDLHPETKELLIRHIMQIDS